MRGVICGYVPTIVTLVFLVGVFGAVGPFLVLLLLLLLWRGALVGVKVDELEDILLVSCLVFCFVLYCSCLVMW